MNNLGASGHAFGGDDVFFQCSSTSCIFAKMDSHFKNAFLRCFKAFKFAGCILHTTAVDSNKDYIDVLLRVWAYFSTCIKHQKKHRKIRCIEAFKGKHYIITNTWPALFQKVLRLIDLNILRPSNPPEVSIGWYWVPFCVELYGRHALPRWPLGMTDLHIYIYIL